MICSGEAFAASYFITTKYLRKLKVKTLNLETGVFTYIQL